MKNQTNSDGETLNNSPKTEKQVLKGYSKIPLNKVWGEKKALVISMRDALNLLQAFKQEGIKNERDCLIFESTCFHKYRLVGEQHEYKFVSSRGRKWTKTQKK